MVRDPFDELQAALAHDGRSRNERFPKVFLDGQEIDLKPHDRPFRGNRALILKAHEKDLPALLARMEVRTLGICDSRAEDFSGLARIGGLRRLDIRFATRLRTASFVQGLDGLEVLCLYDNGRLSDLDDLAGLANLKALEFSGGFDAPAKARSLAPVGELKRLEMLRLLNVRIAEGGLRPLAGCTALRRLDVSNQFETADYAYLSVKLPATDCALFAPYTPLDRKIGDADVMVTGRRKPFLNAERDAARLARYAEEFERLRLEARAEA